ncbi:hypothetical protein Cgig2_021865 [Carnegiea gigantea]|uniref:6-phosphofructo-2-kinase/fructose-2, 6-biphosphatase n=1 Tax=Carnegiea gigantea TaxID=171969 RepID=A0A9Q1GR29_9CARY|nr:hypothetical protein Cgig2_021865 [Carnegiea gigantea]
MDWGRIEKLGFENWGFRNFGFANGSSRVSGAPVNGRWWWGFGWLSARSGDLGVVVDGGGSRRGWRRLKNGCRGLGFLGQITKLDTEISKADCIIMKRSIYEPVEEGSYIKMIDMATGNGGQIQVNTHLTPRPILLTRHGESRDNVRGRIGGDSPLSDAGELYAKKLANFVEKRLKSERAASIWTSTLQRSILTASPIAGFPKVQWRALDEINTGVFDGMTYEEMKRNMPEEYELRNKDKLRYRYPRGESYLDVIQRLEPVIIELERQRAPVVVVSHQAVLRALYAYFADRPLKEIPQIEVT